MMEYKTKTLLVLVIMTIFGTVTPAVVAAVDTVSITNSVHSSSHSGNQSSAGMDGSDGTPGQDGAAGRNGAAVSTEDTAGTAVVSVESTTNGETITRSVKTTDGSASATIESAVETAPENSEPDQTEAVVVESASTGAAVTAKTDLSPLKRVIASIQTFISHYVSTLF